MVLVDCRAKVIQQTLQAAGRRTEQNHIVGLCKNTQSIDFQSTRKGQFRCPFRNRVYIKAENERREDTSLPETFLDDPFRRKLCT